MSNLIPIPRTDKNGRTVVRHMKPEATATIQRSLPLATLPSTLSPQFTDENLLEIFKLDDYGNPAQRESWLRSVKVMRQSQEVTALALELINSGSEGVVSAIRKRIGRAAFSTLNYIDSKTAYPDWENRCRNAWGPKIIPELIVEWARVSVMESLDVEPDSQDSDFVINERIYGLHFALTDVDKRSDHNKDFEYWRGLSLLYFAGVKVIDGEKEKQSAIELAAWLNQREDPSVVIGLARERNLHDVKGLEYILEQGKTNRPLSPGLL
jgi:hypothetical protein